MVRIISAIAIFCLLPSSAALADASAFGTPLWTGLYIGAGGGLKALNNTVTAVPGDAVKDDPGAIGAHVSLDGLGGDGAFFSLGIGGDYQFHDRFLVGAFFDYDFDTLATNVDVSIPGIPLQAHGKVEIDDSWSVGGRLGFLPSPSALLFLSAGYTRLGSTDISANISGPAEISARASVSSIAGIFYGGGFETLLTDHISLKGEYRYTDFGSGDITLPTVEGIDLNGFVSPSIEPTLHVGRLSLGYRF